MPVVWAFYSQLDALGSIGTVEKLFPRLPSTAAGSAWNMSSEHRQGLHNIETKEAGYRCRPVCFRCTPGQTGRLDRKRGGTGRDGTKPNEKSETKRDGKGRDNGISSGLLSQSVAVALVTVAPFDSDAHLQN